MYIHIYLSIYRGVWYEVSNKLYLYICAYWIVSADACVFMCYGHLTALVAEWCLLTSSLEMHASCYKDISHHSNLVASRLCRDLTEHLARCTSGNRHTSPGLYPFWHCHCQEVITKTYCVHAQNSALLAPLVWYLCFISLPPDVFNKREMWRFVKRIWHAMQAYHAEDIWWNYNSTSGMSLTCLSIGLIFVFIIPLNSFI